MKQVLVLCILSILGINISAQDADTMSLFNEDSVKVQEIEPFNYVVLEGQGSYNQIGSFYSKLWEEMIKQSIDPDLSREKHYRNGAFDEDVCSMCGEFCAIKILKDALDKKTSKKLL